MDLKCKKMDCVHNDRCACMSKKIKVNSSLECDTYKKSELLNEAQLQDISRDMFEFAPDIHPFRHSKDIDICCSANCLFNKDGICVSNGISVASVDSGKGVCITNIEP